MSQYGTHPQWEAGWESGVNETHERYQPLVSACEQLLELWAKNKNLTAPAQAIAKALKTLPRAYTSSSVDGLPRP